MATRHVAIAAALLLQQHPAWTGAQLKAALIGAAQPSPALTVYQQGGGRLDVDRATHRCLTSRSAAASRNQRRRVDADESRRGPREADAPYRVGSRA